MSSCFAKLITALIFTVPWRLVPRQLEIYLPFSITDSLFLSSTGPVSVLFCALINASMVNWLSSLMHLLTGWSVYLMTSSVTLLKIEVGTLTRVSSGSWIWFVDEGCNRLPFTARIGEVTCERFMLVLCLLFVGFYSIWWSHRVYVCRSNFVMNYACYVVNIGSFFYTFFYFGKNPVTSSFTLKSSNCGFRCVTATAPSPFFI